MRVFIIAGKSGTGKDEIAKIIKEYYDGNAIITKFSKYIRLFAMEMINWDGKEEDKPRKFLQDMGTIMRKDNKRIFIDRMIEDFDVYSKYYENVIICDARLIDEIEIIKNEVPNVTTIYVKGNTNNKLSESERNHITELELDDYKNFDYTIENKYDDSLKDSVYKMLEGVE